MICQLCTLRSNCSSCCLSHAIKVGFGAQWLSSPLGVVTWPLLRGWARSSGSLLWECFMYSWWRHQMETFSALLAICARYSPVSDEFPAQRPVTRSFDVFFDLHPNKRLSKQWWGWWFETPLCPLWRHRNVTTIMCLYGVPLNAALWDYNGYLSPKICAPRRHTRVCFSVPQMWKFVKKKMLVLLPGSVL